MIATGSIVLDNGHRDDLGYLHLFSFCAASAKLITPRRCDQGRFLPRQLHQPLTLMVTKSSEEQKRAPSPPRRCQKLPEVPASAWAAPRAAAGLSPWRPG